MANGITQCCNSGALGAGSAPSVLFVHSSTPILPYSIAPKTFGGLTVFNRGSRRESKER